jgi:dTDP-4-amino-4,6-dideoxygalactose transaminase
MQKFLGVSHCVAVTNATTGLMILAKALKLTGEIIMPSMSFVATAHAFDWVGLKPVFADVTDRNHLDPADVRCKITPKTSAVVGVHLWGNACDVEGLQDVADEHSVKLIFDAAQAIGTRRNANFVGGFGDAEVFSLHATKIINSIEGGIIATNYADLADQCRLMRNFGFWGADNVVSAGINGKMSELYAIFGLEGLRGFDDARRDALIRHNRYKRNLASIEPVTLYEHDQGSNYHYVVALVDGAYSRDNLIAHLNDKGILARRYYEPGIHLSMPYRKHSNKSDLIKTRSLLSKVLVLPSGGDLSVEEIDFICDTVGGFFQ